MKTEITEELLDECQVAAKDFEYLTKAVYRVADHPSAYKDLGLKRQESLKEIYPKKKLKSYLLLDEKEEKAFLVVEAGKKLRMHSMNLRDEEAQKDSVEEWLLEEEPGAARRKKKMEGHHFGGYQLLEDGEKGDFCLLSIVNLKAEGEGQGKAEIGLRRLVWGAYLIEDPFRKTQCRLSKKFVKKVLKIKFPSLERYMENHNMSDTRLCRLTLLICYSEFFRIPKHPKY